MHKVIAFCDKIGPGSIFAGYFKPGNIYRLPAMIQQKLLEKYNQFSC